jgi:hypothetical protein
MRDEEDSCLLGAFYGLAPTRSCVCSSVVLAV